jgi:hypothetical protein
MLQLPHIPSWLEQLYDATGRQAKADEWGKELEASKPQ